ncbi:MAG: hypothetical protein ACRDHM_00585 [Actinomycetota bacterium]
MDSSEATLARERCELHPDRAAVGVCQRCGRTVCLECAVPFRGAIRCERCAAIELGEPAPIATEPRRRIHTEHAALLLLLVAAAATIPPWHRSGTLTTRLSAWSFGLDGWAALGCLALAAAVVLVSVAALRRAAANRALAAGIAMAGASAFAIGITLARAPGFFSSTPAPFLALGATIGATALGTFRLLRRTRP